MSQAQTNSTVTVSSTLCQLNTQNVDMLTPQLPVNRVDKQLASHQLTALRHPCTSNERGIE